MGETGEKLSWAISGCPNSCSQPQLADVGIITSKLVKGDNDERHPRFDLYRREDPTGFGTALRQGLTAAELLVEVKAIG